jgi:hypothetical protein
MEACHRFHAKVAPRPRAPEPSAAERRKRNTLSRSVSEEPPHSPQHHEQHQQQQQQQQQAQPEVRYLQMELKRHYFWTNLNYWTFALRATLDAKRATLDASDSSALHAAVMSFLFSCCHFMLDSGLTLDRVRFAVEGMVREAQLPDEERQTVMDFVDSLHFVIVAEKEPPR